MTGKHQGHCSVRANDGGTPLRAEDITIASVLKTQKGYATGGFGKWGAGGRDSTGVPEKHGFDVIAFNMNARPHALVRLKQGKRLEPVIRAMLLNEADLITVWLQYFVA